ncbi:MAG: SusC/RagA family TonB-linked outer membrane protein [Proteobacteria bacterium]|nr:SusC/RagA family TonB-linked outer membrane protein [Pseudomonadota bacterium]
MLRKHACLVVFAAALLASNTAEAQRTRIITGTVTEAVTNEAVPGATVLVKGSDAGAITEIDGSFTITGVPVGEVTLSVSSTSHEVREVVVAPDQNSLRIELSLTQAEEIIVTGRAPQLFRKNLANGAAVVQSESINEVPAQTVNDALQGKISGANIQSNSGAPGGGIQMRLRGISTVTGRSTPLYVVDGVIISDTAIANGLNIVTASAGGSSSSNQDNPVNRIADLNPNDIENIEVLKGAAAAALYGSKASNGVVIITTRRGRSEKTEVNITQRLGFAQISNKIGARKWADRQDVIDGLCDGEADDCPIADFFYGPEFDHEDQITQVKLASETSATLTGGTATTKYLISASMRDEPGIIVGTGYEKQTARLAIDQSFGDRLKISVSSNLIRSDASRGVTNNDNAGVSHYMVLSATPSFIDLRPYQDGTYPTNQAVPSLNNPLQLVQLMSDSEEVWRNITAVSANLKMYSDRMHLVNMNGNLGIDRFQQRSDLIFPRELHFEPGDGFPGTVINGTAESRNMNFGINLIHQFTPRSGAWRAATSAGFFYDESEINVNQVFAKGLTAGLPITSSGVSVQTPQTLTEERDQSFFAQEEVLLLGERLTILAALLADRSTVNGDPDRFFFYPKGSATFRLPVGQIKQIGLLRTRLAYGETGNKPQFGRKFTSLVTTNSIDSSGGVIVDRRAGNPDLKPERQREIEGGIDVSAFDGRGVFELTLYQRNISDLLLDRTLAPSTGFLTQSGNFGSLRNRGVELLLQVTPVRTAKLQWLSRTTFSLNRSEITGLDIPAFNFGGFGEVLGSYRIDVGDSASQIIGTEQDENGDFIQIGDGEPDFRVAFVNDVTYRGFTLHMLWDWQQGSDVINLTRLLYDAFANSPDYVENGADRFNTWNNDNDIRPYLEDASFLKLREVSLSYELPKSILKQIGAMNSARVKLSGRNLLTITSYSGLDPEVSNFGSQAIARNVDVAPYPPSRSVWFSIEAGF